MSGRLGLRKKKGRKPAKIMTQGKFTHQECFSDLYLQDMVQAGKMMWEEKVKKMEMLIFQEEFVQQGLRLVL